MTKGFDFYLRGKDNQDNSHLNFKHILPFLWGSHALKLYGLQRKNLHFVFLTQEYLISRSVAQRDRDSLVGKTDSKKL